MENNNFQNDLNNVNVNANQVNEGTNQVNESANQVNGEYEKKQKNEKRKTIILIVILLILVLIAGLFGGILISKNGNNSTNVNIENKEKKEVSKKIDENKPWVYDAEYGKDKEIKKIIVDTKTGKTLNSGNDLVVPYININSEYAKKVNKEIKELYEGYYSKYGTVISNSNSGTKTYNHYELSYTSYLNDNILSVLITLYEGKAVGDGELYANNTEITYNFNIDTLEEATLNEMAIKCGFASDEAVTNKINEWEKKQKDILAKTEFSSIFLGVQKNKYFIDGNGKLNFIYRTSTSTVMDQKQEVEPNKEIELFWEEKNTAIDTNSSSVNNVSTDASNNSVNNTNTNSYTGKQEKQISTGCKVINEYEVSYSKKKGTIQDIWVNTDVYGCAKKSAIHIDEINEIPGGGAAGTYYHQFNFTGEQEITDYNNVKNEKINKKVTGKGYFAVGGDGTITSYRLSLEFSEPIMKATYNDTEFDVSGSTDGDLNLKEQD